MLFFTKKITWKVITTHSTKATIAHKVFEISILKLPSELLVFSFIVLFFEDGFFYSFMNFLNKIIWCKSSEEDKCSSCLKLTNSIKYYIHA